MCLEGHNEMLRRAPNGKARIRANSTFHIGLIAEGKTVSIECQFLIDSERSNTKSIVFIQNKPHIIKKLKNLMRQKD